MKKLKVGNKVTDSISRITGTVINIQEYNPKNPIEDHGLIEIKVEKVDRRRCTWLKVYSSFVL